jgi:hypothetical protein
MLNENPNERLIDHRFSPHHDDRRRAKSCLLLGNDVINPGAGELNDQPVGGITRPKSDRGMTDDAQRGALVSESRRRGIRSAAHGSGCLVHADDSAVDFIMIPGCNDGAE